MNVRCTCGNRMGVSAALAGKTVRCSGCGESIYVAASPSPPAGTKSARKKQASSPAVYISTGQVILVSVIAGAVLIGLALYEGPYSVLLQWRQLEPKANGDVTDIITFGLQAYLSEQGAYDNTSTHMVPRVDGPVTFLGPVFSMTLPEKIVFVGKTTQGNIVGSYDTRTTEVRAEVEYGGYSYGGVVDVIKAKGKFVLTGRLVDGSPQAEVDGQSVKIVPLRHKKGLSFSPQ